jgi:hypothetical protein
MRRPQHPNEWPWSSWQLALWKPHFTYKHNYKFLSTLLTYCPIWVKIGMRNLHIILLIIYKLHEEQEDHTFMGTLDITVHMYHTNVRYLKKNTLVKFVYIIQYTTCTPVSALHTRHFIFQAKFICKWSMEPSIQYKCQCWMKAQWNKNLILPV